MPRSLSLKALACIFLWSLVCAHALTVHLVPHTHDDVGWLKTVDQYYTGQNNSVYHAGVKYILDTVIYELQQHPNRKFSYVEQAFFQRWWNEHDDNMRSIVKGLHASGQLEFIIGGWCMHDEAATYYTDMVDQTTLGHRFLVDEFGAIPTIGWQIDPFGHSSTQAALLTAEVGFDAVFLTRIDYQDRAIRIADKNLEMVWRASPSLGPTAQAFVSISQSGGYHAPTGFCWDIVCNDEPVQDDPTLEDYNVQSRVDDFVYQAVSQAKGTAGDLDTMNIMWTLGEDFHYEYANEWFKNIDKIIDAVNKDGRVQALYSTPTMYIKAKNAEKVQWSVKTDDFFPYADNRNSYWTGYFTSRPALKRYVRDASAFLQTVRQFEVMNGGNGSDTQIFWQAQSVAQHHDAVAGTSKQHVAYDYAKRISIGMEAGAALMSNTLSAATGLNFSMCFLRNISICPVTQNNEKLVATYWNPQARTRTEVVVVPISSASATVQGPSGIIPSQVLVVPSNAASTSASSKYAVAFEIVLSPLGPATVSIAVNQQSESEAMFESKEVESADTTISIQNEYIRLNFDSTTGLLVNITNLQTGMVSPFTQDLAFYSGYQVPGQQDSGAYIFRPASSTPTPLRMNGNVQTSIINSGVLIQEVQQVFSAWATQIVRLRSNSTFVEFEWTVGPVDISDNQGKEVIVRYNTTLESNGVFYTDSNGREMIQRVRNERPTWKWDPVQPVAGNYYPVNSIVTLNDGNTALAVNVERAQGCSSLQDGNLECMVHRRLLVDDGRGVNEPLNETMGGILNDGTRLGEGLVITGIHYVHIVPVKQVYDVARPLQDRVYQPPVPFFSPSSSADPFTKFRTGYEAISSRLASNPEFPINVELMTLQATGNQIIVRVSHQFGITDGSVYNQPATVDLQDLLAAKISTISEMSLSFNQLVDNHKPLIWNTTDMGAEKPRVRVPLAGTTVTLNPMEIRTFNITLAN